MEELFNEELLSQEQILWTGQPETSVIFTGVDYFLVPFSILWGGFAIFWELTAVISGAPTFFLMFGGVFVIMGLYLIFGRFIYKHANKRKTYYAVTNKRVLVLINSTNKFFQGEFIDRISSVSKTKRSDGIGTMRFGYISIYDSIYGNTGMEFFCSMYTQSSAPAFYDITDVDKVYEMVNELRKKKSE